LSITGDQRLQMVLVGFCFGAFLEGAAGFGAPVAITAALLVGLGFNPLYAAGLCLIANTAPVAFGALGIPITVAGKVTGTDPFLIGQMAGRQLPLLSLFVPFWLVFIMDGWRGVRETWPAIFVAAASGFRADPVLHLEPLGLRAAGHHVRPGQPGRPDPVPALRLATPAGLLLSGRRGRRYQRRQNIVRSPNTIWAKSSRRGRRSSS
jgi:hypothetical protein